ncbi:MAG: AsmA-like C-terminal domain-containing protein [Acidobacteria bacterium]|nr:AsmA-like C-terminal domain-containing protein [Acidobacteriota bacterium]
MKSLLRRHPVAAVAAALVVAVTGVALAPRWINAGAVRARIESAASSALGGAVTYERIDLAWFPRTEAVLRAATVSVPGAAHGRVRTVRVAFAFLPLLRGRFVPSRIVVEGADVFLSRPDGRGLWVEGIRADASPKSFEGKTEVVLSRFSAESPRLALEGAYQWDPAAPRAEVSAKGRIDGGAVRSQLLAFAGDDRTIAQIFEIFRSGNLETFTFESAAPSPSDLFVLERMKIRAKAEDARILVEGPGLDLRDVSADVALEGGVLTAERASARLGRSKAFDGRVLVGLAPGDGRLRVEAQVKADLAEVPAILGRAIPDRSFREELALVEGFEGRATGRIAIGECAGDLNTAVSISDLRLSAYYRRLPWPIQVDRGEFTFDGKRVGVSRMSGSLGRSTFSGLAARVRLGKGTVLESGSGSVVVSLEDFFEGVRTRPGAEALARNVRRVSGSVSVDVQRLAGPLARLGEASLSASGTFKEILFDSSSSPSLPPVSIPSGRFAADNDAVRVSDAAVRTLDASLLASGAWSGWRGGASTIDATADGELGPEAIRWGWDRASLPAEFRPAAPIALHGARVDASGGAFSVGGDFVVASGPRLTLDLAGDGKKIDVRNLTVADGDSTASMALLRPDAAFDLRFKGRLGGSTLAKLFSERKWHGGAIDGDFRALVPAGNPGGLTVEGALTATNFEVPTPAGPVSIERADLRAEKNRFDLASSSLVLGGQRFSAAGSATLRDGAIDLDMDVSTGDLAWTSVEKVLARLEEAKKASPQTAAPASLAAGGNLRVSVDSFAYGAFVWKPVLADVRLERDSVAVAVKKAEICGISTTGEARFLPGGAIAVDARAEAAGPDINVPLTCFGFEDARMTGGYEAGVQVRGEGAASDLLRAVRGPLTFKAAKGRVGKATLLTRILGVLNATDVFKGKSRTRAGDAMPYDAITVDGELADGRVSIREAALKSPAITMAATGSIGVLDQSLDLAVLSHPLSTIDKIVQAVPVVRHILGRNFLAVAVGVTGTIGDPKVTITPGRGRREGARRHPRADRDAARHGLRSARCKSNPLMCLHQEAAPLRA